MAAGDSLLVFTPAHGEPPASNFATFSIRNRHPMLEFDGATDETIYFTAIMPRNYAGGGVTVYLHAMSNSNGNNVVMEAAFERIGDEVFDLDGDDFAAAQSVTFAIPASSGRVTIDSIAFTDGAQMDSVAAGEAFRLKITRDANNAADTVTGDYQLIAVELRETPA